MNYLNEILTGDFIRALGWTILHSFWQVAIIAIVLGFVLLILGRSSATTRYYVSGAAMLTGLLLAIITFFGEYSSIQKSETVVQNVQHDNLVIIDKAESTTSESIQKLSFIEKSISYFDHHLPLIVLIWQMGTLVLLLKLLGGLAYSQRLKNHRTSTLSDYWQNKLKELANTLEISETIKLMESAIIKAPVVIGYFKPVILFPLGAIAGLSQDQVEVILAHELAHIKRNDFLINIFQSVIEILFFFHPAIWWISANIRNERENACDDIALSVNKDSLILANALTKLEFLNHKTPKLAAAFAGNKGSLLNRVKRIVNQHSTLPTFKEGFITASILFAGILLMSFGAKIIVSPESEMIIPENGIMLNTSPDNANIISNRNKQNASTKIPGVNDTIHSHTEIGFTFSENGKKYKLVYDVDKNLKEFYINDKKVPEKNWKNHKKEIDVAFVRIEEHEKERAIHEKEMKKHEHELQKHEAELKRHEFELQKHDQEMKLHEKDLQKHDLEMDVRHEDLKKKKLELLEKEKELQKQVQLLSEKKKDLQANDADFSRHSKEIQIHEVKILEQKQELIRMRKQLSMNEFEIQEHNSAIEKHKQEMRMHYKELAKIYVEYNNRMVLRQKMFHGQELEKMHFTKPMLIKSEMREHENEVLIIKDAFTMLISEKLIKEEVKSYEFSFKKSYLKINGKEQSKKVFVKFKKFIGQKSKSMLDENGIYLSGES